VFSYHFTALAVSLAVLGLGLGAYLRLRILARVDPAKLAFAAHLGAAAGLVLFRAALNVSHRPAVLIAAGTLFFLSAGMAVSHYYESCGARGARLAYAFDLLGAAGACLAFGTLFPRIELRGVFVGLAALSLLVSHAAAASAWPGRPVRPLIFALPVWVLFGALCARWDGSPDPLLNANSSLEKPLPRSIAEEGGRVVDTAWSTVGRADLYEHPAFGNVKWIYNDATNSTVLLKWTEESARLESRRAMFAYFPYKIARPKSVLVIGSGAGLEVNLAKSAGAGRVDAVEVNPAIVGLVRAWKDFAGPVYDQAGVRLFVDEGRKFAATSRELYDLVQMSLVLTATAQSGTYALAEGYLYTKEAFRTYFRRLTEDGFLALIDDSPERLLRYVVTALEVLGEDARMDDRLLMRNIAVFHNPEREPTGYKYLLLASRSPIPAAALARMKAESAASGVRPMWIPGEAAAAPFGELFDQGSAKFIAGQPFQLSAPTDDRPFFFNFAKGVKANWKLLRPYVALVLLLGLVLAAMAAGESGAGGLTELRPSVSAFLFGAAFMLVELGLLQKFSLAVGGPTRVLPVLLFSVLLFCGAGSLLSAFLARRFGLRSFHFPLLAAIACLLTIAAVERVYLLDGISSDAARAAAVVVLVAPLGLVLGMPFPNLLREAGAADPRRISYLWAINGLSSVIGATLSLMIALRFGIRAVLLSGCFLYLLAWGVGRSQDPEPSARPS
jgi:hypothetical protein